MDKKKIAVIIAFLALLEFRFVYIPGRNRIVSLDKLIVAKQNDREMLIKLCEEYKGRGERREMLKTAEQEFSLLSYASNLIERRKLEKNITGLQPLRTEIKGAFSVENIRIGVKGITLQQVYNVLYDIETTPKGIYVAYFNMQKVQDVTHLLDVEMELLVVKDAAGRE